jgi:hypothetical protein
VEGLSSATAVRVRTDEEMHSSILSGSRPVGAVPNGNLEVCVVITSTITLKPCYHQTPEPVFSRRVIL